MTRFVKQTPAEMPDLLDCRTIQPLFLIFFFHVVPLRSWQAESFATPTICNVPHASDCPVFMRIDDLAFRVKHGVANVEEFDNAKDQVSGRLVWATFWC